MSGHLPNNLQRFEFLSILVFNLRSQSFVLPICHSHRRTAVPTSEAERINLRLSMCLVQDCCRILLLELLEFAQPPPGISPHLEVKSRLHPEVSMKSLTVCLMLLFTCAATAQNANQV